MLPYVKQLTRVLSERLVWNRARMNLMARLMRALPMQTTTNLAPLAVVMKPQVETDSTYRRLQRFSLILPLATRHLGGFCWISFRPARLIWQFWTEPSGTSVRRQ